MKKGIFVIITVLSLLASAATAFSDAEYDSALKEYYSGHYRDAIVHFKAYVERKPEPSAYYLIGYSLYKLGRFSEADEYFKQAYLIDPNFSPEQLGLGKEIPRTKPKPKRIKKHAATKAQAAETQKAVPEKPKPQETKPAAASVRQSGKEVRPAPPAQKAPTAKASPAPTPKTAPVAAQAKAAEPQETAPKATQPEHTPQSTVPQKDSPAQKQAQFLAGKNGIGAAPLLAIPLIVGSFLAGFFLLALAIGIACYVYAALCLFLIAKKRDVPYPWTAFVPLVQIWPIVGSADKPAWWIIFLFIPIVNIFVSIYLWICITENLGRNKWLGLLMILPIVNLVFLGVLAFSKTGQQFSEFGESMAD